MKTGTKSNTTFTLFTWMFYYRLFNRQGVIVDALFVRLRIHIWFLLRGLETLSSANSSFILKFSASSANKRAWDLLHILVDIFKKLIFSWFFPHGIINVISEFLYFISRLMSTLSILLLNRAIEIFTFLTSNNSISILRYNNWRVLRW